MAGELSPDDIDESTISDALATAGMPDPDLLIRTGGDMRVSNFLLYQIAYTELAVTQTYWPDYSPEDFRNHIAEYQRRQRRFGLTGEQVSPESNLPYPDQTNYQQNRSLSIMRQTILLFWL